MSPAKAFFLSLSLSQGHTWITTEWKSTAPERGRGDFPLGWGGRANTAEATAASRWRKGNDPAQPLYACPLRGFGEKHHAEATRKLTPHRNDFQAIGDGEDSGPTLAHFPPRSPRSHFPVALLSCLQMEVGQTSGEVNASLPSETTGDVAQEPLPSSSQTKQKPKRNCEQCSQQNGELPVPTNGTRGPWGRLTRDKQVSGFLVKHIPQPPTCSLSVKGTLSNQLWK